MTTTPALLTDDSSGAETIETAAADRRADAFRAQRTWHDLPLLWTITRETLYFWLRVPAPRLPDPVREAYAAAKEADGTADHPALLQRANDLYAEFQAESGPDNSYYRNAIIILYLAVHRSEDWQSFSSDRQRFLNAIEAWADKSIKPGQMVEVSQVTDQLIADAEANRAIPKPKDKKGLADEGN